MRKSCAAAGLGSAKSFSNMNETFVLGTNQYLGVLEFSGDKSIYSGCHPLSFLESGLGPLKELR